ncbi:MAG: KamA family radical SAM protein, partial [Planctomycetes bacterium]|nr:KamA family radical SAM protein [Planctomycetota bacterium]
MEEWQKLLAGGINTPAQLVKEFPQLDEKMVKAISENFRVRINRYWIDLAKQSGGPLLKQILPDERELLDDVGSGCSDDPLNEEGTSPIPNLTHRYPDRVLFLISHQCAFYCRYCTRKRKVSDAEKINRSNQEAAFRYIEEHTEIRDVILSGGDPLMLRDEELEAIVQRLRKIPHIEIIRIGTRMPCALPARITEKMCVTLKKYHPIFMMVHFNHPDEVTPEAKEALERLANHGFPTMNQAVLLKGVNDDPGVLKSLFHKLLMARCRPYYLYQADLTRGTNYFRTTTQKGMEILKGIRGWTSGLAVPHYVIDAPGGGGKVPMLPRYVVRRTAKEVVMRNFRGDIYRYPEVQEGCEDLMPVGAGGGGGDSAAAYGAAGEPAALAALGAAPVVR